MGSNRDYRTKDPNLRSDATTLCGRQPLCGTGVTSEIEVMRMPSAASARTEDSRPGPGPLILTSRFLMPVLERRDQPPQQPPGLRKASTCANPEALTTRRSPRQGAALTVGDGDDGVVERGVDVRNAVRNVLANLLANALGRRVVRCFAMLTFFQCRTAITSYPRSPCADPCGCGRSFACVDHASADHGGDGSRGSNRGPSDA